jgi:hypothetical protein
MYIIEWQELQCLKDIVFIFIATEKTITTIIIVTDVFTFKIRRNFNLGKYPFTFSAYAQWT